MDKILISLKPAWVWVILNIDENQLDIYAAIGPTIKKSSPWKQEDIYTQWSDTGEFNYLYGLNFEGAIRQIRSHFKSIDTCMFNVRNKDTLKRLLDLYGKLRGFSGITLKWGKDFNPIINAKNHWYYEVPGMSIFTYPLGYNLPEACDELRKRILNVIKNRQQPEIEDLPFTVLSE